MRSVSITKFITAIRALPSDKPKVTRGKWYTTQKEHWLGWLSEYCGPGAYGRTGSAAARDARFAYNHIVEVKVLLWLIEAAGVPHVRVQKARLGAARAPSLSRKSAIMRKHVPWELLHDVLFGESAAQQGAPADVLALRPKRG